MLVYWHNISMCGIVGYIGNKKASSVLLKGLFDLEYRGYDSAGIKLQGEEVYKAAGPVKNLEKKLHKNSPSQVGIAHTRWATHGPPVEKNAHPHSGTKGNVWMVHNGIIENYKSIKEELEKKGCVFISDTDSEVLAQLIEVLFEELGSLELAVRSALARVEGAYGIVVSSEKEPDVLIAARMGSPLLLGIGESEYIVASDAAAVLKYTKDILYLEDGEIAVITKNSHRVMCTNGKELQKDVVRVDHDIEVVQKDGFEHYMEKEIMEAPEVILNTIRGRILPSGEDVRLGGLEDVREDLRDATRIHIVGCGSAYYAGLYGKYVIEKFAGIPVDVDYASEFRYRNPVLQKGEVVLAVSQSGETADTLEAIREAKRKGILTLGIVNSVGSSIARETDAGVYNHAGPEISVASTKAFISQMVALLLVAVYIGRLRSLSKADAKEVLDEIKNLPDKVSEILQTSASIKKLAEKYKDYKDFLYIGRKYNFPIALEGSLKLKEVSYIHAEGYGAGEMKHGPLAMIDKNFPVLAIAPKDSVYEKMISNIEEIRSRDGKVIIVSDVSSGIGEDEILVPSTLEQTSPILNLIPLQLFAYYVSLAKGLNVDRPRNLAKSVTVE